MLHYVLMRLAIKQLKLTLLNILVVYVSDVFLRRASTQVAGHSTVYISFRIF